MKQTLVVNGKAYTQEIKVREQELEEVLSTIERQVNQYLNFGDNIPMEVRHQLTQLTEAINTYLITKENIDAYLELWQPDIIPDEKHNTVVLTLYNDGNNEFKACLPSSFFDILES